jgi:WD40 repeat protein/energy-coupling factor transporter ATP-binding protein EcfA2
MPAAPLLVSPYPGLRAFRKEEAHIFCGRAQHRAEVLDLLAEARFLAVVGASGSGKSSLVLSGLLPDIAEGQLIGVDPAKTRVVSMQPGLRAFANLAEALKRGLQTELSVEPLLRQGPMGLVQVLDEAGHDVDGTLVLVVDQFEELFRFADMKETQLVNEDSSYLNQRLLDGADNEAQAFVNLLLQTAAQTRHVVYVLLTMRSEFLARCDQFTGLPEAISRSQFLTPRLTRQQLEQAITRPLASFEAEIQPELVELILNEMSTKQDQLPLMQHALARMWERRASDSGPALLTLDHYKAVGGLANALNQHADQLCAQLALVDGISEEQTAAFFRTLAHHPGPNVAPVRRPIRVGQIAAESGLTTATVCRIADLFRAEGSHLLMPPRTQVPELRPERFLDISHESLLRQWHRLKRWLEAEWRQRQLVEQLERARQEWETNAPKPRGDIVRRFQRWKHAGEAVATRLYRDAAPLFEGDGAQPQRAAWALRYEINWPRLAAFCREAFWWKRVTFVMSRMGAGLVILTVLMVVAVLWAVAQTRVARASAKVAAENAEVARAQTRLATASAEEARQAQLAAESDREQALGRLAASETEFRGQRDSYEQLLRAMAKQEGSVTPQVQQLLAAPQYRGLVAEAEVPDVPGEAPQQWIGLRAPVVKNLETRTAVVSLLDTSRGPALIVGSAGVSTTDVWSLIEHEASPLSLRFDSTGFSVAPDGASVATTAGDRVVRLVSGSGDAVSSGPAVEAISTARVLGRDKGSVVLLATERGNIGVWNGVADARPRLFTTGREGFVNGVDYHAKSNTLIASGDAGWAQILLLKAPLATIAAQPAKVRSGKQPTAAVADWSEFVLSSYVVDAKAPIRGATLDPTGKFMLLPIGTPVAEIRRVDDLKSRPLELRHQDPVLSANFSPDGTLIASADNRGRVYLWDTSVLASGTAPFPPKLRDPVLLSGHRAPLSALVWSRQGDYLVTAGQDGLGFVWQNPPARARANFNAFPFLLPSHEGGVTSVAISTDGNLVATAGADKIARVFPIRAISRGTWRAWPPTDPAQLSGGGDLALFSEADASQPEYQQYFRPQPPGTSGLIARLNPDATFVNARWDYSFTSRSFLRGTKVRLRRVDPDGNVVGQPVLAQPMDWGPPASSRLDFDLSPGAVKALGLAPGETVEMEISVLTESQPSTTKPRS